MHIYIYIYNHIYSSRSRSHSLSLSLALSRSVYILRPMRNCLPMQSTLLYNHQPPTLTARSDRLFWLSESWENTDRIRLFLRESESKNRRFERLPGARHPRCLFEVKGLGLRGLSVGWWVVGVGCWALGEGSRIEASKLRGPLQRGVSREIKYRKDFCLKAKARI